MARTVAALYDSRAEAEVARAHLISEANARSPRIITKDTVGAIDGLGISASDVKAYRAALGAGACLLVAQVPLGANAQRIITVLEQSIAKEGREPEEGVRVEPLQGVQVEMPGDDCAEADPEAKSVREPRRNRSPSPWPPRTADEPVRAGQGAPPVPADVVEEKRIPVVEEELRIGKRQVAHGGARVRSFTREGPVEEQVSLREEIVDIERRPSERHLSETDVEVAGLFKERVFEVTQMREEPVVSKIAVVREEIIIRKTVEERRETVHDTVRHTEVEIDDLAQDGGR